MYCLNLKNNTCVNNKYIYEEENKFYYRCNMTNKEGNKCDIYLEDYKVNKQGLCEYDGFCAEFDKEKICTKCIEDKESEYIYFCLNSQFGCTITSVQGCQLCNNVTNFDSCDKCKDGYYLEVDYCWKKNK